jgi:tetratricopeptide (TPR) repeat protein
MITYSQGSSEIEEAKKYYKFGVGFLDKKEYENAFENFNLRFQKSKEIKDKNLIGYLYLAKYHHCKKEYSKSIELFNIFLLNFKDLKEEVGLSECYYNMGRAYYGLSQYDKSLESYLKSLRIYEQKNDEAKIAGVYLLT